MKLQVCRQFACPQVPSNDWTAAAIVVTHSAAAVEMLLERQRDVIQRRTQGVMELLQTWLATRIDFETAWDLSFGRVLRALESDEVDAVDVLAEVALGLMAQGRPGRWVATLCEERRLCWERRWLLPAASEISVDSDGTAATLGSKMRDGKWSITFHRDAAGWLTEGAKRLIQVGARRPITLFSSEAVPRDMIVEDDFHSIFEFPPITPAVAQSFSAGLEILDRYAPEYLEWVERVLRGVLVCRCCQDSRTRSSSWMHAPGIVLVSWSANPIEIAEMLVHESCHQYFYLVSRLGAVVDGSDTQEYYSPAVQRNRPLSKILIGYHAFANVLLFYRTLLRNGLAGHPYCGPIEARLTAELEALEQPLRDNQALTSIGLDLCQPLMERLREARQGP